MLYQCCISDLFLDDFMFLYDLLSLFTCALYIRLDSLFVLLNGRSV